MQSARTVIALVLSPMVWFAIASPEAFAKVLTRQKSYSITTPAPDGIAACGFTITGKKGTNTTATLTVELNATQGEATIMSLGIGSGVQPGCDIYPDSPSSMTITLGPGQSLFKRDLLLELHDHPDTGMNNCEQPGQAQGSITAILEGPRVSRRRFKMSACTLIAPTELTPGKETHH